MNNRYGLDVEYFRGKLTLVLQSLDNYTPAELAQELQRYVEVAKDSVNTHNKIKFSQYKAMTEVGELVDAETRKVMEDHQQARYARLTSDSVEGSYGAAANIPLEAFKYANDVVERDLARALKIIKEEA